MKTPEELKAQKAKQMREYRAKLKEANPEAFLEKQRIQKQKLRAKQQKAKKEKEEKEFIYKEYDIPENEKKPNMPKRVRDEAKQPAAITLTEEHDLNLLKTFHELQLKNDALDQLCKEIYYRLKSANDNNTAVIVVMSNTAPWRTAS